MIFKCKIMKNLNSMSNFDFQAKTHTHNTLLYHPLTQISTGASQYEEHFDCIQHFSASFVFFSHFSRPVYICCWCWTGQNRIFFDFLIGKKFFFFDGYGDKDDKIFTGFSSPKLKNNMITHTHTNRKQTKTQKH